MHSFVFPVFSSFLSFVLFLLCYLLSILLTNLNEFTGLVLMNGCGFPPWKMCLHLEIVQVFLNRPGGQFYQL